MEREFLTAERCSGYHYIISNYEQIDRDAYICVLDNHLDILEYFDHDSELASTALIGIRIAKFTGENM